MMWRPDTLCFFCQFDCCFLIANTDIRGVAPMRDFQPHSGDRNGLGRCRRRGEADANAVDAAVGAGEDFEAEAVLFNDFAGEGDVAGDL
jgi:hypothetical protein